eukprot:COSAG05_NODE_688_length_7906_cov_24.548098_6_plen_82_part_00
MLMCATNTCAESRPVPVSELIIQDSTQRDMESIDKSTVADRQRKKILHIKDPSLWIQDRWDPGTRHPWATRPADYPQPHAP